MESNDPLNEQVQLDWQTFYDKTVANNPQLPESKRMDTRDKIIFVAGYQAALKYKESAPTSTNNRSDEIAFLESFLGRAKDVFTGISDYHWIEVTINERLAQLRAVR